MVAKDIKHFAGWLDDQSQTRDDAEDENENENSPEGGDMLAWNALKRVLASPKACAKLLKELEPRS